jgi:hypoxanthine phosphoribosyltransferase
MSTIPKEYITADRLVRDSFELARKVYDSGFRPEGLLVLWRGGTPVGIVIHEFLLFKGITTHHLAVKAESYTGIGERAEPRIEALDAFMSGIRAGAPVLIVDDIFDSGHTLQKVRELLAPLTRDVKIATLFYKSDAARVPGKPDYYLRATDRWIVFPHELMGLTDDELRAKDPAVHRLVRGPDA